jgi:hypothetical protein
MLGWLFTPEVYEMNAEERFDVVMGRLDAIEAKIHELLRAVNRNADADEAEGDEAEGDEADDAVASEADDEDDAVASEAESEDSSDTTAGKNDT